MARAIDASELMAEIQACSWDSEQDKERAEDLVLGMPTLTPPNEPLICDTKKIITTAARRREMRTHETDLYYLHC